MPTVASVFGGNLCDTLWVTPLARYVSDLTVWMRGDDVKARAVAPILDGVCSVLLEPNPPETRKAPIHAHVTQQILSAYGFNGKPSVPRVVLTFDEIQWAIEYLRPYGQKRVALVAHCSGSGDPTNYRAHYVQGSVEDMVQIAKFWKGAGYTVLQFGPAQNYYTKDIFTPFEGCIQIRGLTVRQLAACYYVIGKLISVDTGDQWLMLAVGGRAAVLVPPHSDQLGYRHWDLHLNSICWGDERPRVDYIPQGDWWRGMNTKLFTDIGGAL